MDFRSSRGGEDIPDEVKLQITVRSYGDAVRKRLLASIRRIVKAESEAAGASVEPAVTVREGTPATLIDPALTDRVSAAVGRMLGTENVSPGKPVMGGEDFSEYGRAGVPAVIFWVGAVEPARAEKAKASGSGRNKTGRKA